MPKAMPKVVIVGGNFAGLVAASRLSSDYDVTVIDPRADFEWTPNIHEILSGVKTRGSVVLPRSQCVARYGHTFVHDYVTHLDTDNSLLKTRDGLVLHYDACLIAAGSERTTFGIPGAEDHSIGLRLADDAQRMRKRLLELAQRKRPATVSIVVVGGGVSGIEAVGELLRDPMFEGSIEVHVVEKAQRVLSHLPASLASDVVRRAQDLRVYWHTNTTVEQVDRQRVTLTSGAVLRADLCIWSAGLALPSFLHSSALCSDDNDWLPVEQTLRSVHAPNVLVAGDCAGLPKPLRKQAYYAMDMGRLAGDNIKALLAKRPLRAFCARPMPMLVAFGSRTTWLVAGQHVVASPLMAAAKEGVYQATMARFASPYAPLEYCGGIVSRAGLATRRLLLPQLTPLGLLRGLAGGRILS